MNEWSEVEMNSCPPCPNMIGSQVGFPWEADWERDSWDHLLWQGREESRVRRRRKRSWPAVLSEKGLSQPTKKHWSWGALQNWPNLSWALYALVDSLLGAWTRWPSLTEPVRKGGWQLRAHPWLRQMSHSFLKGSSS